MQQKHRFFNEFDCWKCEFTIMTDKGWRANKNVTIMAKDIHVALQAVKDEWPDANIIKIFKGSSWGNEGILDATET